MHDILSANPVGPFIMLVLRDKTNNRLQADWCQTLPFSFAIF